MFAVTDLLRCPAYAVPLLVNLTGSVWFFLLIGKAGECGDVWGRREGGGGERRGEVGGGEGEWGWEEGRGEGRGIKANDR